MDGRAARARAIIGRGGQVERVSDSEYVVLSQSGGDAAYDVRIREGSWRCGCEDHARRGRTCKHILAVELAEGSAQAAPGAPRPVAVPYAPLACRHCGSGRFVRNGIRRNAGGPVQRYRCRGCGRQFSGNAGYRGMRLSPREVLMIVAMCLEGMALRRVARTMRRLGTQVSHVSAYNAARKYVGMLKGYLAGIRPVAGPRWHADEVLVRVLGADAWVFVVMDGTTRFVLSYEIAARKDGHNARGLLRGAADAAGAVPRELVTDRLPAYGRAHRDVYRPRNRTRPPSIHVSNAHIRGEFANNNVLERFNGDVRQWARARRGVKRGDGRLLDGFVLHHNFLRPHAGLGGDTPADRAGIRIAGPDRLATLVRAADLGAAPVPAA